MQSTANRKCSDLMANWIWVGGREEGSGRFPHRLLTWAPVHMPVSGTGSRTRSSFGRHRVS